MSQSCVLIVLVINENNEYDRACDIISLFDLFVETSKNKNVMRLRRHLVIFHALAILTKKEIQEEIFIQKCWLG